MTVMSDVYVLVGEDRHLDVQVEVFTNEAAAVRAAQQFMQEHAWSTLDELNLDPEDSEINDSMRADGWIYFQVYSIEGDSVRVVKRKLNEA